TDSDHAHVISPNILERNFHAERPNQVWVSDITYVRTRLGWSYLCTVLDLFARKIVGWSVMDQMPAGLVVSALEMAVASRNPSRGLVFHSDRGVQYASSEFRCALRQQGMIQSMSRKGNCWDNACAESFFSLMKEELGPDEFADAGHVRLHLFEYIELFYNPIRIHGTLDYMSPNEYEKRYVA
ncbi:MAG: IS3 family transposase, partial [Nitrospirae bacterium]|nr:IS3 family transposase [Fimbriimonadaceae bacterium]